MESKDLTPIDHFAPTVNGFGLNVLQELSLIACSTNDNDPLISKFSQERFAWKHHRHKYCRLMVDDSSDNPTFKEWPQGLKLLIKKNSIASDNYPTEYYIVYDLDSFNEVMKPIRHRDKTGEGSGVNAQLFIIDESISEKPRKLFSNDEKKKWYKYSYNIDLEEGEKITINYKDGTQKIGIIDKGLDRFICGNLNPLLHNPSIIATITKGS